jgi:hypothetical protein
MVWTPVIRPLAMTGAGMAATGAWRGGEREA